MTAQHTIRQTITDANLREMADLYGVKVREGFLD